MGKRHHYHSVSHPLTKKGPRVRDLVSTALILRQLLQTGIYLNWFRFTWLALPTLWKLMVYARLLISWKGNPKLTRFVNSSWLKIRSYNLLPTGYSAKKFKKKIYYPKLINLMWVSCIPIPLRNNYPIVKAADVCGRNPGTLKGQGQFSPQFLLLVPSRPSKLPLA